MLTRWLHMCRAGVTPDHLLVGVQQMVSKNAQGVSQTNFAVPLMTPVGEPSDDGTQTLQQQPLAWCIEKNRATLGDRVSIVTMPTPAGPPMDHFMLDEETMTNITGATHQAVWGSRETNDITVSAKALGPVTGDRVVTIGLRVDADVLCLSV